MWGVEDMGGGDQEWMECGGVGDVCVIQTWVGYLLSWVIRYPRSTYNTEI